MRRTRAKLAKEWSESRLDRLARLRARAEEMVVSTPAGVVSAQAMSRSRGSIYGSRTNFWR